MDSDKETRIEVFITSSEGHGLVYSTDDIKLLRTNYRIIGSLVGAVPQFPAQVDVYSSPLLLSKDEVTLLLKKDVIVLIDVRRTLDDWNPTKEDIDKFHTQRKEESEQQFKMLLEQRREKADKFTKKRKSDSLESANTEINDAKELTRQEKDMRELRGNEMTTVHLININRIQNKKEFKWDYPKTLTERNRCIVYQDLWEKGFYMTSGAKFGGDFLAYPGDPLQFHAHYVVIVKTNSETLLPLDVISYGRLGVTVKKTPVLATVVEHENKEPVVKYISIDWQGVT